MPPSKLRINDRSPGPKLVHKRCHSTAVSARHHAPPLLQPAPSTCSTSRQPFRPRHVGTTSGSCRRPLQQLSPARIAHPPTAFCRPLGISSTACLRDFTLPRGPFHVLTPRRLQLVLATCYVITHITDLFGDLQQLTADLQWLISDLFGISSSSCRPRPQRLYDSTSAKLSIIFNLIFLHIYFSSIVSDSPVSVTLVDLLYMFFSCSFPYPSTHSRAWRSRPRHARGLGFTNLRVVGPEGLKLTSMRSFFKCLLLLMQILKSCGCKTLGPRPPPRTGCT
jgi:hypothetical protein